MLKKHKKKSRIATWTGVYLGLSSGLATLSMMARGKGEVVFTIFIFAMGLLCYGSYHSLKGKGHTLWNLFWLLTLLPGALLIYYLPDKHEDEEW